MSSQESFCLEVSGDFACFTRPEMKVERVSYDVITPSACRGIFEAIMWKPGVVWQIHKIEVLKPVAWINLRRNEVSSIATNRSKKQIFIEDDRQQRAGLFLRDVAYRLHAKFCLQNGNPNVDRNHKDFQDCGERGLPYTRFAEMFKRRARKGQCFNQPYLGTREFSAKFTLVEATQGKRVPPIEQNSDLGWMLYDIDYSDNRKPEPMFFNAKMKSGIIIVPDKNSEQVVR